MLVSLQVHAILPIEQPDNRPEPTTPPDRVEPETVRPVSTLRVVLIFTALAVTLVLGTLFLNKLADMSQEEDCALAHRRNC
jgi:hypothetical protein